jgi:ferredoxin-type protein NapF
LIDPSRRRFLRGAPSPENAVPAPGMGRVQVSAACLTRHGVECRICGDACDTRALRFVPARGSVTQLLVDPAACTGCGDCVAPCPVAAITLV